MSAPILPTEVSEKAASAAGRLAWNKDLAVSYVCHFLEDLNEHELSGMVALKWRHLTGRWPLDFENKPRSEEPARPTPGPWERPTANVFRVIAPTAPHENKPQGICPPYPYAVVCEADPDSVGGAQAAANARAISRLPEAAALLRKYVAGPVSVDDSKRAEALIKDFAGI